MGHDLSKIERQLETLNRLQAELTNVKLSEELLLIIHRPGWTTIAESTLVMNALETLTHSLEGQIQQSRQLIAAAKEIKPTGVATTAA